VELLEKPDLRAKQIIKNVFHLISKRLGLVLAVLFTWMIIYIGFDWFLGKTENYLAMLFLNTAEAPLQILVFLFIYDISPVIYLSIYRKLKTPE